MYRRFVENMRCFLEVNYSKASVENYRYKTVKSMETLLDVKKFLELKGNDIEKYKEISNVIWEINKNIDEYPSFKVFSWELWGYGFDGEKYNCNDISRLNEQLKIIDLLLSTQYWH